MLRYDKWYGENESKEGQYKKAEWMDRGMGRFHIKKVVTEIPLLKKSEQGSTSKIDPSFSNSC